MLEVLSIHIGKTAGTAFRHVLSQVFGQESLLWDYPPYTYEPTEPLPERIRAIHGHVAAEKYLGYFPEARWIVWFRHPVFRLISEYFFAQVYKDVHNPLHVELVEKKLGLLEFAEHPDARNIQSGQIVGKELNEFYFVGLQEFYAEDLLELQDRMNWGSFEISADNQNPHPNYYEDLRGILNDVTLIKQLAAWNQQDMELYQEALSLRAVRRCESLALQYTLSGLRQSQPVIDQMQNQLNQLATQLQQSQKPGLAMKTIRLKGVQIAERLLGFFIDLPDVTVTPVTGEAILVEGWVIGEQSQAVTLQVMYQAQTLTETPINLHRPDVAKVHPVAGAENSGFSTRVFVTGMRPGSELLLKVMLADQNMVEIGIIRFVQTN